MAISFAITMQKPQAETKDYVTSCNKQEQNYEFEIG